jgi:DNA (cytosine-5)-methyltransferase 1
MHNALHAKDGSEQNNKHQSHHAKCIAFNVSEEKLRKDEVSPSLEQQTKNSFKVSIIPLQNKETAELSQNVNKQRAAQLHQEVYGLASTNAEDTHSRSMNDGVIKPPTLAKGLSSIKVGTDCSGLDAPIIALKAAGIDHEHVFSAETDQHCIDTINANSAPGIIFGDIMERDNSKAPYVDMYIAGFPCQPFSTMGKQQGMDDNQGRGTVFFGVLEYIQAKLPKIFILENVKGLSTINKGRTMNKVLTLLRQIRNKKNEKCYHVHWKILNTRDFGIPHSRPRWYCVGIRKDCSTKDSFEFPGRLECPSIDEMLDGDVKAAVHSTFSPVNATMERNIMMAKQRIKESGGSEHQPYVVDCDASRQKSHEMFNVSPCITRSRNKGHWLIHKNRRTSIPEMMRLQGINPRTFKQVVSDAVLGQQLGNSMSVNVIEQLMIKALTAANLLKESSMKTSQLDLNRWKSGRALQRLQSDYTCLYLEHDIALGSSHQRYHLTPEDRKLMIDSGASRHMANWMKLTEVEKLTVRTNAEPININTANGMIYAVESVDVWVEELDMYIEFLVSPYKDDEDGPCVISLGKLLRETGGNFFWEGDGLPIIQINRKEVPCWTSNEVPFMYVQHEVTTGTTDKTTQQQPIINNPGGEASSSSSASPVTPFVLQVAREDEEETRQPSVEDAISEKIDKLRDRLKTEGLSSSEIKIHHLMKSLNEQLTTIKNQPIGTGQLIEKHGDLLEAKETFIVHQCNCICQKPKGLAETVFERFPNANVYEQRRRGSRQPDTPGTISVHGRVVNFYSQLNPGKPNRECLYGDTRQGRLRWFGNCLEKLYHHMKDQTGVSIAFPWKIGCGLAGGNWKQYLHELKLFAKNHPTWKVAVYNHKPESKEKVPDPPKLTKEIEAVVKDRVRERIQKKRRSKKVVMSKTSCTHNIFTHFPKDPDCDICKENKPMKAPSRSKDERECDALPEPVVFGDSGTLDHKIINEDDKSKSEDRAVCVILDRATYWLQAYADKHKSAEATIKALQQFYGPQIQQVCKHLYSDNSKEIKAACKHLLLSHDTSISHVPQSNGIAENAVKRVKEGTACTLTQSGFCDAWWNLAMYCFCFLKNVVDILWNNKTAYANRFGQEFRGPIIPFGAEVHYYPNSPDDRSRSHEMSNKHLSGLFLGYKQQAGGGWSDILWIADWDELNEAKHVSQVYPRDIPYQQVKPQLLNGEFIFPLVNGDLEQPGLKASELSRRAIKRQRQQKLLQKEEDERLKACEAKTVKKKQEDDEYEEMMQSEDTWTVNSSYITIHHKKPRTKLYVPTESTCPVPLKYLDVMRFTSTNIPEKRFKEIEDFWLTDGPEDLSFEWTGSTRFALLKPDLPNGWYWVEGRATRKQATTRPDNCWPELWNKLTASEKEEAKRAWSKTEPEREKHRKVRKLWRIEPEEEDTYNSRLAAATAKYSTPPVPQMDTVNFMMLLHQCQPSTKLLSTLSRKQIKRMNNKAAAENAKVRRSQREHQERHSSSIGCEPYWNMIHHEVSIKEAMQIEEGKKALDTEWSKLEKPEGRPACWDVNKPESKAVVMQRGRDQGIEYHFGSIKALCHIKNYELDPSMWKYKGRIVFRGDLVKDETGHKAVFTEQSTSASYMAGTKFIDIIARFPGCKGEDADATSAFTQITLKEAEEILGIEHVPETFISLPKDRWPDKWHELVASGELVDPVCPLVTNLYGHPLAGLLWDKCSQKRIQQAGFDKVKGWESLYVHKRLKVFLGVYVDDFHMAGDKDGMLEAWKLIKTNITLGKIEPFAGNTYLGCTQHMVEVPESEVKHKHDTFAHFLQTNTNQTAEDFQNTPIKLPGQKKKKAKKKIHQDEHVESMMFSEKGDPVSGWYYAMEGAAAACVERYCELAKIKPSTLRNVGTPCIDDHTLPPEDFVSTGALNNVCSQAVLKCLYMTRLARPELYWTVNSLAREVTRWTVACDKRLHRLICYIHYNKKAVIKSWVGDEPNKCKLMLFCDASFAGDLKDSKSTSGSVLCLVGPRTFCPITWMCKKQGAVSHSSTEAEIIALDAGLRLDGLPSLTLWDLILNTLDPIDSKPEQSNACVDEQSLLPKDTQELLNVDYVPCNIPELSDRAKLLIMEDNDAVIKMCMKVRAPTMRHVQRTHRIDVDALLERIHNDKSIWIKYINTKQQLADIFTKGSFSVQTWNDLCKLLQIGEIKEGNVNGADL